MKSNSRNKSSRAAKGSGNPSFRTSSTWRNQSAIERRLVKFNSLSNIVKDNKKAK